VRKSDSFYTSPIFFVSFFAIPFKFYPLFFADFYFFTSKSYSFDFKASAILLNTNKC